MLALGLGAVLAAGTAGARPTATVTGAGSTFAAPLYFLWAQNYKAATVTYNSIGSGGGIAAITAKQVDFGASDAPLTKDQFGACPCVQIPLLMSGTAIDYNIPGASPGLNITGPILADIYLGKIGFWDNAKIKKLNKGKTILPHVKITPIFRSDGRVGRPTTSRTTCPRSARSSRTKSGSRRRSQFPSRSVGARGSNGVSSTVKQHRRRCLPTPTWPTRSRTTSRSSAVKNSAGKLFHDAWNPLASRRPASLVKKVPANNEMHIVDPPATKKYANAYPICTFSWAIMQKSVAHAAGSQGVPQVGAHQGPAR